MFKIGDRVRVINKKNTNSNIQIGDTGVIIEDIGNENLGVKFDRQIDGCHSCDGECKDKHGWYCYEGSLEKLESEE